MSGVSQPVPHLPEDELLSGSQRVKPKSAEQRLSAKPGPDCLASVVEDVEVRRGRAAEELQGHRCVAGVGDFEEERHRLARTGALRCLQR